MSATIPFDPRRFQATAAHYLDGRPHYSDTLIKRIRDRCALDKTHRVMDLGCGPGQLAVALAPHVDEVVGVDPEPAMLAIAQETAKTSGLTITFVEGSSYDIGPQFGKFRLVTIGRAFHWMDRAETLRQLDRIIDPGGAIVLLSDGHLETPENSWRSKYEDVIDKYSKEDESIFEFNSPGWLRNEAILIRSSFNAVEIVSIIESRRTSIDHLVKRAFSKLRTTPTRLGSNAEKFATDLRMALRQHAVDGLVSEVVRSTAIIAQRPPR